MLNVTKGFVSKENIVWCLNAIFLKTEMSSPLSHTHRHTRVLALSTKASNIFLLFSELFI